VTEHGFGESVIVVGELAPKFPVIVPTPVTVTDEPEIETPPEVDHD
jgi:hypothetical protein